MGALAQLLGRRPAAGTCILRRAACAASHPRRSAHAAPCRRPQPENKAAMLQHPEYVPEALQTPDGFVRASACEAARKGGQPRAIVDAVCAPDAEVPWPTAEALHASDNLEFVSFEPGGD